MAQGRDFRQAPKALTAIKQGQVAQQHGNLQKAIALYCVAASTGNPEGYFRIGRLLATGPASVRSAKLANSYLAMAMRLGNRQAARYYNARIGNAPMGDRCGMGIRGGQGGYLAGLPSTPFNVDSWVARQPPAKQKLVTMLRHAAKHHKVDARLVLAIAIAESNLNSRAVSPKNAQGLMQPDPRNPATVRGNPTIRSGPEHQGRRQLSQMAGSPLRWRLGTDLGSLQCRGKSGGTLWRDPTL